MIVPKGKTIYHGCKIFKQGDTIPKNIESKYSKIFDKGSKPSQSKKDLVFEDKK